jgi:hypothetical protein
MLRSFDMILIMRGMRSLIPAPQAIYKFVLLSISTRRAIAAISESLVQLVPWDVGEVEVDTRVSD